MPKNCGICSDSPCEREICKRELFRITLCKECPANCFCSEDKEQSAWCNVARKIEKLVNERRV